MVITTAGPFEKYGQTLVKLCAEEGVDYADSAQPVARTPVCSAWADLLLTDRAVAAVSGESDFLRAMVAQHDATAQQTGARIVVHCGNDCIPWDLTVFEMHKHAQSKGAELIEAQTFGEFGDSFGASGGTLTTAIYQLGKQRSAAKPDFDPLLRTRDGRKSDSLTKITNPKNDVRSNRRYRVRVHLRAAASASARGCSERAATARRSGWASSGSMADRGSWDPSWPTAYDAPTHCSGMCTAMHCVCTGHALGSTALLGCCAHRPSPPPTSAAAAAAAPRPTPHAPRPTPHARQVQPQPGLPRRSATRPPYHSAVGGREGGPLPPASNPPPRPPPPRPPPPRPRLAQRTPPALLPQYTTLVAAAVVMPSLFQRFLPGPGEGPSREAMESNYLNLHAIGKMVDAASGQQTSLKAKYHFPGDTGYLYTAKMLVEAGMQLLEDKGQGGVLSPAAAFGSSGKLVLRLDKELGAKLEIGEA